MLDSISDDALDLLVGDGGLRGNGVDGATALDELEESSRSRHGGTVLCADWVRDRGRSWDDVCERANALRGQSRWSDSFICGGYR